MFLDDTAALGKMGIAHLAHACYTQISGGGRRQASIARAPAQRGLPLTLC